MTIAQSWLGKFTTRPLWETTSDLARDADLLRVRRYGMIEIVAGQLDRIVLQPWPKMISLPEIWWRGNSFHATASGDRCRMYYDQPLGSSNFLALKYVVSSRQATYPSLVCALHVLDEIARIKGTDALVCELSNLRLSDKMARRFGWERHCLSSSRRHYIKRFYGVYSPSHIASGRSDC